MFHRAIDKLPSLLAVAVCVLVATARAQESAVATDADATDAVAAYQSKLDEWKTILKSMRRLQLDYVEASAADQNKLSEQWVELVDQGRLLLKELQVVGVAAYSVAPGEDRELERFLVKILGDGLSNDRFEDADSLAKALIQNGCEVKGLYDVAGVAAFVVNDFESAEEFLKTAEQRGTLDKGRPYMDLLEEYKGYWKEEQEFRKKEAEADDLPRVKLVTSKGDIVLELFENEAPDTVGNFINLVEDKKFYDGLSFHRVLPGFMAQGGCPLGTGQGGPGYTIFCECHQPTFRKHFRGSLSMAKAPARDTGGSQFFLTFVPTAHLNGEHTVFGRIIEGLDVLAQITRIDPDDENKPQPDYIESAVVLRKRDHEYKPNKAN